MRTTRAKLVYTEIEKRILQREKSSGGPRRGDTLNNTLTTHCWFRSRSSWRDDGRQKINGRKRHAPVDTDGCGLVLEPHPASIQDRDRGEPLLRVSRRSFSFIQRVFADIGYAGDKVAKATLIEIVRKNPDQVGSAVNPRPGSSSGSSPGSGAIDDSQRTSRPPSTSHAPSVTPHPSRCSCVGSPVRGAFEILERRL